MSRNTDWASHSSIEESQTSSKTLSATALRRSIVISLVLIAVLAPRVAGLDRLITPDETRWLARSANFYYALAHGNFADTYQIEHPGVLTMWAGTFAFLLHYPAYAEQAHGQVLWWQDEVGAFLRDHGYDPLEMLVAARLNMIMMLAAVLIIALWSASRLLGLWPAAMGFLFIALDPFHIALSRLLHVDGLSSGLVLLSLIAFLNYLYRGQRRRDLLLSGAAAGFAWLAKSPMLFLVPFVGLMIFIELLNKWRQQRKLNRDDVWQALLPLVIWGTVGLAVFVLLWPAMWVEPVHTLRRMLGGMLMYADQGHDSLLYFNGRIFEGDPGIHFYPITYLWRTTPVVLAGLMLAGVALVFPAWGIISAKKRRPLGWLLLFTILFTLFMTLGAKKFDRYLLPIYLPLDLVAGVGWVAAITWVRGNWASPLTQFAAPTVLVAVTAVQMIGAVSSFPYYFSYYNPMLGGTTKAPDVMMIGWGEGLDQAARFLNSQPDLADQQVATGVWSTTFSYYYRGTVVPSRFEPGAGVAEDWTNSDYYVLYINEKQRGKIPPELITYLDTLEPAKVIHINGLDYVYIYDIRDVPAPDYIRLSSQ